MCKNIMKLHILLALCSVCQATYYRRISNSNRMRVPSPSPFRPGVMLQKPWPHQRLVQMPSNRAPYFLYRHAPQAQRFTMKHFPTSTRTMFSPSLWKTSSRLPISSFEQDFVKAASSHNALQTDGGAIHTIPAPNLRLSEKPIVVVETTEMPNYNQPTSEAPKPMYDVTEKYADITVYQAPKIDAPTGFSKSNSFSTSDFQARIRNQAALQVAAEYGLPAVVMPQSITPQQFGIQDTDGYRNHQNMLQNPNGNSLLIHPNPIYESDPSLLRRIQHHILQTFPAVEFIPYTAATQQFQVQPIQQIQPEVQAQIQVQQPPIEVQQHQIHIQQPQAQFQQSQALFQPPQAHVQQLQALVQQPQIHFQQPQIHVQKSQAQVQQSQIHVQQPQIHFQQPQIQVHPQQFQSIQQLEIQESKQPQLPVSTQAPSQSHSYLYNSDFVTKQTPASFTSEPKGIVQREVQETTVVTLSPQTVTEPHVEETTASQFRNITLEPVVSESVQVTSTVKYVLDNATEAQKTTPLYFAQVGQSVGDIIAKGFYSALNDVRAAAALEQIEKPQDNKNNGSFNSNAISEMNNTESNTIPDTNNTSQTKTVFGIPFSKDSKPVKLAYTLVRTDEKEPKVYKDGSVYAGQIIEASVSEDQEFNKQKETIISKRAPIRLIATPEEQASSTTAFPKISIVKAKIPPQSKLTFDDKTGQPVLRIYASYVDNQAQKEAVTAKLSNMKHVKEALPKKANAIEGWKSETVQSIDESLHHDDKVTQFGLKIKARSDDYLPMFDDYE